MCNIELLYEWLDIVVNAKSICKLIIILLSLEVVLETNEDQYRDDW